MKEYFVDNQELLDEVGEGQHDEFTRQAGVTPANVDALEGWNVRCNAADEIVSVIGPVWKPGTDAPSPTWSEAR